MLPDLVLGTDAGDLLYLNDGEGNPFDTLTPLQIGSETNTTALALGDLDSDGDPDLVVGNNGTVNHVYLNDGTGVFLLATGPGVTVLGSSATSAVAVGDIDGDGDLDLVIGVDGGPSVVHLNNGVSASGDWNGFAAATVLAGDDDHDTGATTSTTSLALADVNGDHHLDLIVANNGQANHLYLNGGTGFSTSTNIGTATEATTSVAVGDINGDELPDIVFGNSGQANRVHLNSAAGFNAGTTFGDAANTTTSVVLADIDTDGDLDLIQGNDGQANAVYTNDGTGTFTLDTTGLLGGGAGSTLSLAVGDVDVDGNADLVVGRDGDPDTVHLNDGIGNLGEGAALGQIKLLLQPGPYLKIAGEDIVLSIAGQTLTGSFEFEQQALADGTRIVSINVPQATLSLADGAFELDLSGSMLITNGGIGAKLSLGADLAFGPVVFDGDFNLLINTSLDPIVLNDVDETRLPGGPFFRIEGLGVTLDIAGARLEGNFAIEQSTNDAGQKRLLIGISGGSFSLPGLPDILTDIQGIFVVLPDPVGDTTGGIAGRVSGTVVLADLLPPGVVFQGTFGLAINQSNAAVMEEITIGEETLSLDLPAGPYVRIEGVGVELTIFGQTLSGNFAFEKTATDLVIAASHVELHLGDGTTDFVSLTEGEGAFVVLAALSKSVSVTIASTATGGTLTRSDLGGNWQSDGFAAGRLVTISGETGSWLVSVVTDTVLTLEGAPLTAGSSTKTVASAGGMAGSLAGTVALNVPGVSFVGTLGLELNNSGSAVDRIDHRRRRARSHRRRGGQLPARRRGGRQARRLRAEALRRLLLRAVDEPRSRRDPRRRRSRRRRARGQARRGERRDLPRRHPGRPT